MCGLDLGWRQTPEGGLRVATLRDSDGHEEVFALPPDWMRAMDHVQDLQRKIDRDLLALAEWVRTRPTAGLPEAVQTAFARWAPGESARRIAAGALHDAIRHRATDSWPSAVRAWYRAYRRDKAEMGGLRRRLHRRRKELYRLLARRLAQTYRVIAVDKLDLAGLARRHGRGGVEPPLAPGARANRVRAALTDLRKELRDQTVKHGARLVEGEGHSTGTCHACGAITAPADRSRVEWTCEHCGASWDQDRNAAANLVLLAATESARDAAIG